LSLYSKDEIALLASIDDGLDRKLTASASTSVVDDSNKVTTLTQK